MTTKNLLARDGLFKSLLRIQQKNARLLVESGADPWVVYHNGYYYYCRVLDDWQIVVNKSKRLEGIGVDNHVVWNHPLASPEAEVWATELHFIEGKWYIYFTMGKAEQHRMYALEAVTDNPQGPYELKGKLADPTDKWAIDGTPLQHNGKLYFIWSGWQGNTDVQQNLYIAPMANPWTISGKRVLIAAPNLPWEKSTRADLCDVNEGPEVLEHNGRTFVVYSASHSLTDDYCLGMLSLAGDDPLKSTSWQKAENPVFRKTDSVFGPGHASFTKLPDGSDWIVYHTARFSGAGWDRQVLAQKFTWFSDGTPNFGKPLDIKQSQLVIAIRRYRKAKAAH